MSDGAAKAAEAAKNAGADAANSVKDKAQNVVNNDAVKVAGDKTAEQWNRLDDNQKDAVKGVGAKIIDKAKEKP